MEEPNGLPETSNSRLNFQPIKNKLPYIIGVFVLLLFGTISTTIYIQYLETKSELSEFKSDPDVLAFKENNDLIDIVGRHVLIPTNIEPTIATVRDSEKLKQQPFFANVENGDKVIIFPTLERAIVYRPAIDKIIEAAPVNITDLEQTVNNNQEAAENSQVLGDSSITEAEQVIPAKIVVLNGTRIPGLAAKTAELIEEYFDKNEIEIIEVTNAEEAYDESTIYSRTVNEELLSKILEFIGGKVSNDLPEIEKDYSTDITIIVGKDFAEQNYQEE